jgi:hypothetical protein
MGNAGRDAMARSRAEAMWGKEKKKDDEFQKARQKEWEKDAAKTARLRELRLAIEQEEAARKASTPRRKPTH